jgi:peptide/nickel transport system ATP-binding protein
MNTDGGRPYENAPLLRFDGLKIEGNSDDRWQPIVNGVSLELRRGEFLGLVGESGAGKSTLGLAAMGYTRPGCRIAGGRVTFDGIDLFAASERTRTRLRGARIAYVAQSAAASFNPALRLLDQTVETAVYWNLQDRAAATADAIELYRRMRLPHPESIGLRYPHQVSGGQLQRIMTAMAVSCRPDLIIFDEPTTALDVSTQREVLIAMREIVREVNAAALYITHDLAVVAQMAHRVVVLRNGSVVEEAATRAIMDAPQADYTKTLWAVRKLSNPERESEQPLLLEATDLSLRYGDVHALKGVSIEIPRKTTVAVVGESGSGKSTLARVIGGVATAPSGSIRFDGKVLPLAVGERDKETRRRIQLIYQSADTSLNPRQTVRDILARPLKFFFGLSNNALERRIDELMQMVELTPALQHRYPGELSGGQKQRVSIARALAARPDLIICDEVTSALDQVVQEGILKMLLGLQERFGISYLFITHDIVTVRAIADRVVVMNRGEVVEQGPRSTVLQPPHAAYTADLLAAVPDMDPSWLDTYIASQ